MDSRKRKRESEASDIPDAACRDAHAAENQVANALCANPELLTWLHDMIHKAFTYIKVRSLSQILPTTFDELSRTLAALNDTEQQELDIVLDKTLIHLSRFVSDQFGCDHFAGRVGESAPVLRKLFSGNGNVREVMNHLYRFWARVLLPDMVGDGRRPDVWRLCTLAGYDVDALQSLVIDAGWGTLGPDAAGSLSLSELQDRLDVRTMCDRSWTEERSVQEASRSKRLSPDSEEVLSRMTKEEFRNRGGVLQGLMEQELRSPLGENYCPWIDGSLTIAIKDSAWIRDARAHHIPLLTGMSMMSQAYLSLFYGLAGQSEHNARMGLLACTAYLVPISAHSIHEILMGGRGMARLRYDASKYSAARSLEHLVFDPFPRVPPLDAMTGLVQVTRKLVSVDAATKRWKLCKGADFFRAVSARSVLEGTGVEIWDFCLNGLHKERWFELKTSIPRCVYRCKHSGQGCKLVQVVDLFLTHSWTPVPMDWDKKMKGSFTTVKMDCVRGICEQVAGSDYGGRGNWGSVQMCVDALCFEQTEDEIVFLTKMGFFINEYLFLCRGHGAVFSPNGLNRLWFVMELAVRLSYPDLGRVYVGLHHYLSNAQDEALMNKFYRDAIWAFEIDQLCVQQRKQSTSIVREYIVGAYTSETAFLRYFKIALVVYSFRDLCFHRGEQLRIDVELWVALAKELQSSALEAALRDLGASEGMPDQWFEERGYPIVCQEQALVLLHKRHLPDRVCS